MKRFLIGLFLYFLIGGCGWLFAAEDASESVFHGGKSEILSSDPDRATKAIRKWSEPSEWNEKDDPEDTPYFWDFDAVGRQVFIRIIKNDNREGELEVWLKGRESQVFELFKTYRIAFFSGEVGPKTAEGDWQAPEGFYYIKRSRMNPASNYHLSMDIGYPNAYDRHHERTGDYLMIHGKSVSIGCFAMTDASIEQIYTLVDAALKNGQAVIRVHCFPFRMSATTLEKKTDSRHFEFWENLSEGWDWFEAHLVPPDVGVIDGRYVFSHLP